MLMVDSFSLSVYPAKHLILMCETLGALCSHFIMQKFEAPKTAEQPPPKEEKMETDVNGDDDDDDDAGGVRPPTSDVFFQLLPKLLTKLESIVGDDSMSDDDIQLIELLSAVCLQAMIGTFMPKNVLDTFDRVLDATQYWTQYRIARSASRWVSFIDDEDVASWLIVPIQSNRYGQHFLAAKIYDKIASNVSLEKFHFFLTSLSQISKAECILNIGSEYEKIEEQYKQISTTQRIESEFTLAQRLEKAVTLYWKALATLKASSSPTHPLIFQSEWIRLRGQLLEAMFNLVIIKNTQSITPPPTIAQIIAQNSRDHLQKYGHVTNQLRKAVKILKVCEDSYSKLYKSAFDADPCTLEFLEM